MRAWCLRCGTVRPPDPPPPPVESAYVQALRELAEAHGVTHTGVTDASVLQRARAALDDRIQRGLDDGMQFTFRDPARSTDPQRAVRQARSVFVAARPYLMDEPDRPVGPAGRVGRYAWVDHYAPLREALWAVAGRLRNDGWKAVAFADDNSIVDREVAHRAGIGWFGKNANLLVPGAGSWFVLGCVVTTAPLPAVDGAVPDGCGSCRRCLDGCPTGAIIEPGVIDAARCLAWVLQKPGAIPVHLREAVGHRIYGCDDCQEVCPPTVRLGPKVPAPASNPASAGSPVRPRAWVDVVDLLRSDDHGVLARWGRWYLADRDPRWARRNALVVLGNCGVVSDEVEAVLADYVAHRDPVLRDHAVWAARRLGITRLVAEHEHPAP